MKKIVKLALKTCRPLIKIFLTIFFEKRFITGRWFENSQAGYLWAFKSIWTNHILRLSPPAPWPKSFLCSISNPQNISFHPDDLNNFQSPGTYFQNFKAHIYLGQGTYIAPNVGIITTNHQLDNLDNHQEGRDVIIGKNCWLGINSVILPGVILGDQTIVAAGSVVTKSYPAGHMVIGGTPAAIIKSLS